MFKKIHYLVLPLAVFGVLAIGSIFSQQGMIWYDTQLLLPAATPPKWVFPLVWNTLGVLTALALIIFYDRVPRSRDFWLIATLFGINGLLNSAWTAVFFGMHKIGLAWWVALALEGTLIVLIALLWNKARSSALLLIPYAVWVLFALYLNGQIWLIN